MAISVFGMLLIHLGIVDGKITNANDAARIGRRNQMLCPAR